MELNEKYNTHIFKSVFAELHHEMEKDQRREPQTPHDHLLNCLNVQHPKDEDKLVEDEVPEFILKMLVKETEQMKKKCLLVFAIVSNKTTKYSL